MKKAISITLFSILGLFIAFVLMFAVIFSISPDHSEAVAAIKKVEGAGAGTERYYLDEDGYYTFVRKADTEFKILQLTDIHFGGGVASMKEDDQVIAATAKMVDAVKPDLIVLTGDITFSEFFRAMNLNNMHAARTIGSAVDALGVPWTISFGNHDTEDYQYGNEAKIIDIYLNEFENCVFTHPDKDLYGRSNHAIRILNSDGTLDQVIMMIDSNDYENGMSLMGYDYIHPEQIQWYKDTVTRISEECHYDGIAPSLAYFHIPLTEYRTAWDLYEQNSDLVVYNFGAKNEKICPPKDSEKDTFFEEMVEFGSLKETFCGHEHKNNFSITYRGITLTYGLSMDYLAYKDIDKTDEFRGGTLVKLTTNGNHTTEQVHYASIK